MITVDRHDADVTGDLSTAEGRRPVVEQVTARAGGVLDGVIHCAGVSPWGAGRGALVVSASYFGTVALLEGLRPALARSGDAAVILGFPPSTLAPDGPAELEHLCLVGAEDRARELADQTGATVAYRASEAAVALGFMDPPRLRDDLNDPESIRALEHFRDAINTTAAHIVFLLGPEARAFWRLVAFVDGGLARGTGGGERTRRRAA